MITGADWIMVVFTGVIGVATVAYVVVTWKLLRQTKSAFLGDMICQMVSYASNVSRKKSKIEAVKLDIVPFELGLTKALSSLDKELGKDFKKAMKIYVDEAARLQRMGIKSIEKEKKK